MTETASHAAPVTQSALVSMRGIEKSYGDIHANDHIDFSLIGGEIHCLLGENGAGKTTLMKILFGLVSPDAGEIEVAGEPVKMSSPAVALGHGIGMVHQHFMLLPNFTVAENVVLGSESNLNVRLRRAEIERRVMEAATSFGIAVNPAARVNELTVDAQQQIEILKLLFRGARILIMDEPTSSIGPRESEQLFSTLDGLRRRGRSIVLITHKLSEVTEIADRVTVLRQGCVVRVAKRGDFSERDLARSMVGSDLPPRPPRETPNRDAAAVLRVHELTVRRHDGTAAVSGISFTIQAGEVLGLVGVEGNGQRELADALSGLRHPESGTVDVDGEDITAASPRVLHSRGISVITEDRQRFDLIPDMTIAENLALSDVASGRASTRGFLHRKLIRASAKRLLAEYGISAPTVDAKTASLSGGNQQKVVLARELSRRPRVLVASQPTRGLDIGAAEFVHGRFRHLRSDGCAILLITLDLDELLALSDRIGVLYKGRLVYLDDAASVSMEKLANAMAGLDSVAA